MATDRIRMFVQRPDGNFICRIDDDYFLFNTHTYRFCNLPQEGAEDDMNRYRTSMSLCGKTLLEPDGNSMLTGT